VDRGFHALSKNFVERWDYRDFHKNFQDLSHRDDGYRTLRLQPRSREAHHRSGYDANYELRRTGPENDVNIGTRSSSACGRSRNATEHSSGHSGFARHRSSCEAAGYASSATTDHDSSEATCHDSSEATCHDGSEAPCRTSGEATSYDSSEASGDDGSEASCRVHCEATRRGLGEASSRAGGKTSRGGGKSGGKDVAGSPRNQACGCTECACDTGPRGSGEATQIHESDWCLQ